MKPLLLPSHVLDEEAEAQRGKVPAFLAAGTEWVQRLPGAEMRQVWPRLLWLEEHEKGRGWQDTGWGPVRIEEGLRAVVCTGASTGHGGCWGTTGSS